MGKIAIRSEGLQQAFQQVAEGRALTDTKVTTLQNNLDQLIPGLAALLLTLLCMVIEEKVSPIIIIIGLFLVGIGGHLIGLF